MVNGTTAWAKYMDLDMRTCSVCGRQYETYTKLPDAFYTEFARTAIAFADQVCLVADDGTQITYGKLKEYVDSYAQYLERHLEIKPQARVAILFYNSPEFCISFLALNRIGAVVVPLPGKFRRQEILSLLKKSKADYLLCDPAFSDWFSPEILERTELEVLTLNEAGVFDMYSLPANNNLPQLNPEDAALLIFTSGTTSLSKGVILTNFNIMHAMITYQKIFSITDKDSTVIPVPIYHVTGMLALFGLFVISGGRIFLHRKFEASKVLECVRDNKITFLHASPTVFSLLLKERYRYPDLPSLRMAACGSSHMPVEKIRKLHEWIPQMEFRTVYGLTETSSPATIFPRDAATDSHIGSSGLIVPGVSVRIVDETERELPDGEIGEVEISGSVVLLHYEGVDSEKYLKDGWLLTGDMGYLTKDGYLYLVDRKKDMINRGGEKICSYDVENELYRIEGIADAAVVGVPDDLYGEVPMAFIVREEKYQYLTEETIKEKLKDRLAKYEIPSYIQFFNELPVTQNGKIDKKKIREIFCLARGEK